MKRAILPKGNRMDTEYLDPERTDQAEILRQQAVVSGSAYASTLDDFPIFIFILNKFRQIVYCNERSLEILPKRSREGVIGMRPGEALSCAHAYEKEGGCGTTSFCLFCGASKSIESALSGRKGVEECSITRTINGRIEFLELDIWTKPISIANEGFVLFAAFDISAEKRRQILERTFYHDIINTATGLQSVFSLLGTLPECDAPAHDEYLALASSATDQLVDEILSQRELKSIEEHSMMPGYAPVALRELFDEILRLYRYLAKGAEVETVVSSDSQNVVCLSDRVLLRRVVGNLVKNAIEASSRGDTVSISSHEVNGEAIIEVRNAGVMPLAVQGQVFKRSFSTKGKGRGIGTFSVRLIVEDYLHGSVAFRSSKDEGTIFTVHIQIRPDFINQAKPDRT